MGSESDLVEVVGLLAKPDAVDVSLVVETNCEACNMSQGRSRSVCFLTNN